MKTIIQLLDIIAKLATAIAAGCDAAKVSLQSIGGEREVVVLELDATRIKNP